MKRAFWLLISPVVVAGCISHSTETVPANPFSSPGPSSPPARQANFAAAAPEISMRVDAMGRRILAANPQVNLKPLYCTIGDPRAEIFHQGTTAVYVTAGLVGMCKTDAQLAALLSNEFGKMISEREARTPAETRDPAGLPPPEVPTGPIGGFMSQDMTHQAELARYEKKHPRRPNLPPPDPRELAQRYLEKAGFAPAEMDGIAPLLAEAERNYTWERQIKGSPRQGDWTP